MTQVENDSLFMSYEMEGGIRINFYEHSNNDTSPIERVHLEKERNGKMTRKQIVNVYCDNCKKVWLNNLIDEYDEFDQTTIKIGALMVCNNIFEVCDMLKELKINEELKKELIESYIDICTKKNSKISININL